MALSCAHGSFGRVPLPPLEQGTPKHCDRCGGHQSQDDSNRQIARDTLDGEVRYDAYENCRFDDKGCGLKHGGGYLVPSNVRNDAHCPARAAALNKCRCRLRCYVASLPEEACVLVLLHDGKELPDGRNLGHGLVAVPP